MILFAKVILLVIILDWLFTEYEEQFWMMKFIAGMFVLAVLGFGVLL